jgi:hypothetical protein
MLLGMWEINEIKSTEQKLRVKNIQKFNKTCSDYECEAWTLTNQDELHLRMFKRRIFFPLQNKDGSRRIGMNYKLDKLIVNAGIVRFIKSRIIAWIGHVQQMDDKRTPRRVCKPIGMRIRGRPRKRWVVDIEEDMQIMGIRWWRKQCKKKSRM